MRKFVIQLICPDQKGIIAQLTAILSNAGNNILSIEQHVDIEHSKFYIRILSDSVIEIFPENELQNLSENLKGQLYIFNPDRKINVAILGSLESSPIYDLLIKNKANELIFNCPAVISNHYALSSVAEQFSINFIHIENNKELMDALQKNQIELIILARYMQIIPPEIVAIYKNNIINIHHGFLPAFKGAKPYHQAYNKGVKIIGATAHYVTNELDEGPIIAQDVVHINHKHSIKQIIQLGREIERGVLYSAVKSHLEYKIIVYNNKTIIFD